jgi:Fe2+ or Zn2+ uptake regulation protein
MGALLVPVNDFLRIFYCFLLYYTGGLHREGKICYIKGGKQMGDTEQRRLILDIIRKDQAHLTADEIYQQAVSAGISKGTVYRNLDVLVKKGDIKSLSVIHHPLRYDGIVTPHEHLVCECCGSIQDISMKNLHFDNESCLKKIRIRSYSLVIYHVCSSCAKKIKQKAPEI